MTLSRGGRRVHVILAPETYVALQTLIERKGGRKSGFTMTAEVDRAVLEHLARESAAGPLQPLQEVVDEVVSTRLGQIEVWLRPMLANAGINATAALLASVEAICGTRIEKARVKEYVDVLRGRAYALYRRPGDPSN